VELSEVKLARMVLQAGSGCSGKISLMRSSVIGLKRSVCTVAALMGDRAETVRRHYARILAEDVSTELPADKSNQAGAAAPTCPDTPVYGLHADVSRLEFQVHLVLESIYK
jgi:hypothetical protein